MLNESSRTILTNVRAVTPEGIIDDATVVFGAGIIESVGRSRVADPKRLDGRGLLALPALVDMHSDALEKEVAPRQSVRFPGDFALSSFEARVRANGISTMFHGIGFEERRAYGRSIELADELCDAIRRRNLDPVAGVDHRVLHRLEARTTVGLEPLLRQVECAAVIGGARPLISFEDHTPGQGQYRDLAAFRAAIDPVTLPPGETVDSFMARLLDEARSTEATRAHNLQRLSTLALVDHIRLIAHDCEDARHIEAARRHGATIAEFPLTIDAATAAREQGMPVVMGAPNALRGISHSGNASAGELVALGLCDVLASDYQPSTLLAAIFELARRGDTSLVRAARLATVGPAEAAGLDDRGRLEAGARSDIVLVDDRSRWPRVLHMWHAADTHDLIVAR